MPNTIPGVVLPGDAEYKNEFMALPTNLLYAPHQSDIFFLKLLGRKYTIEDAEAMVRAANGTLTIDYVTPQYLEKQGASGLVLPVVNANMPDERKTVYQWEETEIYDYTDLQGTFTGDTLTVTAGTEYTFTVDSTTYMVAGGTVLTSDGSQLRINSVESSTEFKGEAAQNSFTTGSSNFPGTDTAANGVAVNTNDTFIILAPGQEVAGYAVEEVYSRPTIRRNAFQTIAVEIEKSGHAVTEDGTHATVTSSLKEREFQTWYKTYSKIDNTLWFGKYGRGMYGASNDKEVYYMDGIYNNIGTSKTIGDYSAGTTLNIDVIDALMTDLTATNNPKNTFVFGQSYIAQAINKIGRENSEIQVEPGATEFGTTFLQVHTHRGIFKFFELPPSKSFLDASGTYPLYALNMDLIKPVTRSGRNFKVEKGLKKDGTQDAVYDVLRGDISLMTCHKTSHFKVTGITG
jgi:hypothetical protein